MKDACPERIFTPETSTRKRAKAKEGSFLQRKMGSRTVSRTHSFGGNSTLTEEKSFDDGEFAIAYRCLFFLFISGI